MKFWREFWKKFNYCIERRFILTFVTILMFSLLIVVGPLIHVLTGSLALALIGAIVVLLINIAIFVMIAGRTE